MTITRQDVNDDITAKISGKTIAKSITPVEDGTNRFLIMDYVDQETSGMSGAVTLSSIPSELPYTINSCNFGGGIAYLPAIEKIGKQIYVIATTNITIRANVSNTSKMFVIYGTFVSNVTLTANQMYRFIYIGFGDGIGGITDGYWKAEQI